MGYGRRGWHTFSRMEGSLWVPVTLWPHLVISQIWVGVQGCDKPTKFLYITDSDNQLHRPVKKKVLEGKSNETVKFHSMYRSMEEDVSIFKILVKEEQRNGGPQEKRPLAENESLSVIPNKEQGMGQSNKRQKGVEGHPIYVCVDAREEACRDPPP